MQHQVGGCNEARLDALGDGLVTQADGEVAFANATGTKEHNVLRPFHEGQARQLVQLLARGPAGELEVIVLKQLAPWEAGKL